MASHQQPALVEASHLLQEEDGTKATRVPQLHHQVHPDSDTERQPEKAPQFPANISPPCQLTFYERLSASWSFEILGLVISALSLAAMVYILQRYDGRRIPNWHPLSFNTLISILAVVSKMAALYGATSAISQLKWVWFTEQGRQLVDYKTFDHGSRGISGAMLLAWSFKGRKAAALGALAIVIGAAAGPFAQQIVQFYDAEYTDVLRSAWVSKADTIAALGPKRDSSTWSADPALKANAITSLFQPTQEVLTQPRLNCPSGNCTWDPFTTLAFCPTCVDVSPRLNRTCRPVNNETTVQYCNVAFPGDTNPLNLWYIDDPDYPGSSTYMVVNSTNSINATAISNVSWPTTIYQSIRAVVPPLELGGGLDPNVFNNGIHLLKEDTRFIGSECALSPCVQHLKASVSRGVYTEEVLDVWSEFEYQYPGPIVLSPPWATDKNFTIIPEWVQAISFSFGAADPLGGQLMGSVSTQDSNQAIHVSDIPAFGMSSRPNDALQAAFYADFNSTTCPTPEDNVACSFRALGAAMTKSVRDAGSLKNGTEEPYILEGKVHTMATFIRIEWPWFVLPALIWVLSLVTVIAAMIKSRDVPLWRDSVLPLVLLSGGNGPVGRVGEVEMQARAESVGMQLVGNERRGLKLLTEYQ